MKVGSKSWLLTCSSNITLNLPSYTGSSLRRELIFCYSYLSLLYFWTHLWTVRLLTCTFIMAVGRFENPEVPVVMQWALSAPPGCKRLTDVSKSGVPWHPAPLLIQCLAHYIFWYLRFWVFVTSVAWFSVTFFLFARQDGQDEMKISNYYLIFLQLHRQKQPQAKLPKWDENNTSLKNTILLQKICHPIHSVRY